ncbi:RNA-binding transcriptional accessory protein [bacterium]|nr:RNA-binding transcriptional accessory protein [bacterium]
MNFELWFKQKNPSIPYPAALAVIALTEDGSTVPFIARYRKEQTGNLDEVGIQTIIDSKQTWDETLKRQAFIVEEIERQKKLTPELKAKILSSFDLSTLENLYLPYKQKRKTKATIAKEAGLEPLAQWVWDTGHGLAKPEAGQTLELYALAFLNPEKEIKEAKDAIAGVQDILIERLAETVELRELTRKTVFEKAHLKVKKGEGALPNSKFDKYFDFNETITTLLKPENSHRYMAIRRGWMEKELSISFGSLDEDNGYEKFLLQAFENAACSVKDAPGAKILLLAARLALKAHVLSSVESEVHKELKTIGDTAAIKVFAENVRKLLLASPYGSKAVLGIDPGIRTGCKVAVVDDAGKYIGSTVIHLQSVAEQKAATKPIIELIKKASIKAIAIGNGTAGRETETFIRQIIKDAGLSTPVVMVSEAGASVYSASPVAREEFPDLDVTVRGAISIARRLQDPLAELVKVDPKSIGVGQYQHDVSPHALEKSLDQVVDSCVNSVGVNLNTASYHLLSHVSGIGPALAKAIVDHRKTKGLFNTRRDLLNVPRFSEKVFEQAAGFLRISGGSQPLDNTGVHPERYVLLEELAASLKKSVSDLLGAGVKDIKASKAFKEKVGQFTFEDIIRELEKPGRDPREQFVTFNFRDDISEVKDLKPGMTCPGIVTNVTNFGAFIDIGVHQDGLAHISQLADRFVKDPHEVVSPGDRVTVRVLEVNVEKNQIALTLRSESAQPVAGAFVKNQQAAGFKGGAPRPQNRPQAQQQGAFNNPFASLGNLKVKK